MAGFFLVSAVVFGMGFSAREAAAQLRADGIETIAGTSRTPEGAAQLSALGFAGHVFDGAAPSESLRPALHDAATVIFSIAPDELGDPALRHHAADLDAAPSLSWLCYYSTIGVYGDRSGDWVDETGATDTTNARSQRRIAAEDAFRAYARQRGVPLCILRLAGIYGPGRSVFDKLRQGTARRVVKPGQVFNRIHVADIARITAHAAARRLEGIFNLADDEPAPPQDLVSFAAGLMGVAPPPEIPFESADFTPMQKSFYRDNKRVSNRAIKQALGIELLYPTYRAGLAQVLENEQ
jgi:nucleoside-diphosphate-sugar epimerase